MIDDLTPHRPLPKPSEILSLREKAGAMAEIVLETAYEAAVNTDTAIKIKMEFIELCAKLGDLMPKQSQQQISGPGFAINIVFDGPNGAKAVNTIEHTPDSPESLPETPPFYTSPALSAVGNLDLEYTEMAA